MKVPSSWLQRYLSRTMSTRQIMEALEAAGIEIEQVLYAPKLDDKIVTAEVKKVIHHPQADRLKIVFVSTGTTTFEVVCGAPNLELGQKVVLAKVGATLPDGTKIAAATIRGQRSNGMICSPRELGLGDDHSGILVLPPATKLGLAATKILQLSDIIDVSTPANRFDLMSLVGLALEVSAQTATARKLPPVTTPETTLDEFVPVKVETEAVRRYLLQRFRFETKPNMSQKVAQLLEGAGIRSINPVVDITNFVMIEQGQPLHAFDADKIKLPVVVRQARAGEQLVTLDGAKRRLTAADLVIADRVGVVALAGVMGGKRTEVEGSTTNVLIEAASFDPVVVRKMAQRHGLRTEASSRFERGLPVKLAELGLGRAATVLATELGAIPASNVTDLGSKQIIGTKITVTPERLSQILSIEVTSKKLQQLLPRLGFEVTPSSEALSVTVPWWRPDIIVEEDVAEEMIRLIGYDAVPATLPVWRPQMVAPDGVWPRLWQLKSTLKGLGLFEVITYSFLSQATLERFGYAAPQYLKVKNPLSIEQAYMRRSLLPSLLAVAVRNQDYRGGTNIYEVSRVFHATSKGKQPDEPRHLGALVVRRDDGYGAIKAILDGLIAEFNLEVTLKTKPGPEFLPNLSAEVWSGKVRLGTIGQLHPRLTDEFKATPSIGYLELNLDLLLTQRRPKQYRPISRYPSVWRDLTIVVKDSVWWQDVATTIIDSNLAQPQFLSDYRGADLDPGSKSLAIRLEMSSLDGTLTSKEAEERLDKVIAILKRRFSARVKD